MSSSKQLLKFGRLAHPFSVLGEIIRPREVIRYDDAGKAERILIVDLFDQIIYHNLNSDLSDNSLLKLNIAIFSDNSASASNIQNLNITCQVISTMPITLKIIGVS